MRIAFNIAILLSILVCPWWVAALLVIAACFLIERYYEAIVFGIFTDILYGTSFGIHDVQFLATVFSLAVFLIASGIRTRLAW